MRCKLCKHESTDNTEDNFREKIKNVVKCKYTGGQNPVVVAPLFFFKISTPVAISNRC